MVSQHESQHRDETRFDLVIRGGRVIDPANGVDALRDVLVKHGKIAGVVTSAAPVAADRTIDARGKLVTPGLIDLHVHCYLGLSNYGLDPDRVGIRSGCTHVNDTGSTGCFTLGGFRDLVAARAITDVTCFPNLLGFGVPENWGFANPGAGATSISAEDTILQAKANPNLVRGVKVHCEPGEYSWWGDRTFAAAVEVATECKLPIYAHLGYLFPEKPGGERVDPDAMLDEAISRLRPGDIIGHANSGHQGSLILKSGAVHPRAKDLRDRGLLLEVGYGLTTTFAATRALFQAGIALDICSSDAHGITLGRPRATPDFGDALSYTLAGTMTKMWALGMPLVDVIRSATATPARVLGLERAKGNLSRGVPADVTILDLAGGQWELTDNAGERLRVPEVLVPTHTIKGGRVHELHAMEMVEFQQEYVRAGLRVDGLRPARRLDHCSRIASGQWWNDPRARQAEAARAAAEPRAREDKGS